MPKTFAFSEGFCDGVEAPGGEVGTAGVLDDLLPSSRLFSGW